MKIVTAIVPLALAALLTVTASSAAPPKKRTAKPPVKAAVPKLPPMPKPVHPGPHWAAAFSPDGTRLAVGAYQRIVLFDAATGAKQTELPVPGDAVRGLAFSKDGRYLAAGSGIPASGGTVVVFDVAAGKVVRTITGHFDTVETVAFAGNLLLSASNDEKVRVTDIGTGASVGVLAEHVGRCLAVAAPTQTSETDGGEIFVTGGTDNAVKVWDAKTRRVVVNFDQCASPVWSLAFLPRPGQFVAGAEDGRVRVFGVRADPDGRRGDGQRTGYLARTLQGHDGPVYAVAASADGKWIVSGAADRKVIVWNSGGGKAREMTEAKADIYSVSISPDSRLVAAAALDGKTRVYSLADGKLLLELPGGPPPKVSVPMAGKP